MPFELFTNYGRGNKPKISIRSNGQIGINSGAIHRYNIHEGPVHLFFDKDSQRIGIRLVNDADQNTAKLSIRNNNGYIGARAFLDYYGIDYSKTRTCENYLDRENKLIVVDARKPEEATLFESE